jgi:hypothetical protein
MRRWKLWLALAALGVATAHANMMTAMASAGLVHSFFLNPLIAWFEAVLLRRLFKVSFISAFGILLVANYGSYFLGDLLNRPLSLMVGYPLYWLFKDATWYWTIILPIALVGAMALMYVLTVLSEALLTRTVLPSWRSAIRASAIVNAASYVSLIGLYGYWSDWGFLRLPKEPNAEFVRTAPATIYFIDWQRRLCTVSPKGGKVQVVHEGPMKLISGLSRAMSNPLKLSYEEQNSLRAFLWFPSELGQPLQLKTAYMPKTLDRRNPHAESGNWRPHGFPDWRTEPSPYSFVFVRHRGMTVYKNGQPHWEISMNLPFNIDPGQVSGYFLVSGPSVLPGDYVVYEFAGRVMITHVPTGRTAKLADGFAPIAIVTAK